jgi:hypothetical protein
MDASLLKLVADAGTVGILLYVLIQVLGAYKGTVNRVTDLLEREITDDAQDGAKPA